MAPGRPRVNRANNFYDVGVQGRKTGITLTDRGVYDEHGLEALSGIFSSPEKSPPRRSGNITASESMDLQESTIPELTTSHQILRNSRTHLPPPRSRSPKKTMLGSSPRRQSSMAPRGSSVGPCSPTRASSHPIARRLDFEQDDSSLQETPALSGSGARRGKRSDVYDIPEDNSPAPQQHETIFEESLVQEEITANEDSAINNAIGEESFAGQVGDDTITGAEVVDDVTEEESEIVPQPVKEPAKRGRKRKSDVLEPAREVEAATAKSRKRGPAAAKIDETNMAEKKSAAVPAGQRRRSQRVSDIAEQDPSILDALLDSSSHVPEPAEEAPVAPKRRGRPPRVQPAAGKENTGPAKSTKAAKVVPAKEKPEATFKKPVKPLAKPKDKAETDGKHGKKAKEKTPTASGEDVGKLVDVYGNPLSKQDIEKMSTTSTTSRYGRGRHLSVFREMDPDAVARVGRTGRHRVAPIDFWKNESIAYDTDGSMTAIVKNQDTEPEPKKSNYRTGAKKKRSLTAIEEEEVELEPWEEDEGVLRGNYKDWDPVTDVNTNDIIEDSIAWAPKGISPVDVADGSFRYQKIGSGGSFFNWGLIELRPEQMKRTKNSRRMHMVFNVQSGTVEVKVAENEFIVHKAGLWQVPRGNTYSIRNVGSGTARVFFAQACEVITQVEA
ncbi:mitotic fidelity of chromosome transmission-related protein [Coniothyrium glycines]